MKFYIAMTCYNPLARPDPTIQTLRTYQDLPGEKEFHLYVNKEAEKDVDTFWHVLFGAGIKNYEVHVAPEKYKGYEVCWAHKPNLFHAIDTEKADIYIYTEDDMEFTLENFEYWHEYKDILDKRGLEPGFLRFEEYDSLKIPFDNHFELPVKDIYPCMWGDLHHECKFMPYFGTGFLREIVGFIQMPNPYKGMMILDQKQARKYMTSRSAHPIYSYRIIGHRNWPIADRSSMGTTFEDVPRERSHRAVLPVVMDNGNLRPASCSLVRHQDQKYTKALLDKKEKLITVEHMLTV